MLWIGERLRRLELASIKSFQAQGHRVCLHSYVQYPDTPRGVVEIDAAQILPRDRIIRHRSGSLTLFSDLFRYQILRRYEGVLWSDLDIIIWRPVDFPTAYMVSVEHDGEISNALMKVPSGSGLLSFLIGLFDRPEDALAYLPERKTRFIRLARKVGIRTSITRYPWGAAGPHAVAHYLKQTDLGEDLTLAPPFHWSGPDPFAINTAEGFDPGTSPAFGTHLHGSSRSLTQIYQPTPGSLYELCLDHVGA